MMRAALFSASISVALLVAICAWQSVRVSELEHELLIIRVRHDSLSSVAANCDSQVTQCWAWRARMELELERINQGASK